MQTVLAPGFEAGYQAATSRHEAKIKALVEALDVLLGYHDSFAPSDLAIAVKAFDSAKETP